MSSKSLSASWVILWYVPCSRHFCLYYFDDLIVSDKIEVINDLLETNVSCCDLFLLCNWPNFIILIQLQQIYFLCHTKKVCKITLSAVRIYPYRDMKQKRGMILLKRQFKPCKILKECMLIFRYSTMLKVESN